MTSASDINTPSQTLDTQTLETFGQAIALGSSIIGAVRVEQLGDPTPCDGMDVGSMLGHLVSVLDRVTALACGDDPFSVIERPIRDATGPQAWADAARRAEEAWRSDGALTTPMALPWIAGTGADVLASYFSEIVVHLWDVATATGQVPAWDAPATVALIDEAFAAHAPLPAENRMDFFARISAEMGLDEVGVPFAEAVAVPDDARAIDRLVAWNGRDPGS